MASSAGCAGRPTHTGAKGCEGPARSRADIPHLHRPSLSPTRPLPQFEKQFENLDVQSEFVEQAMQNQAVLSTPEEDVNMLVQQARWCCRRALPPAVLRLLRVVMLCCRCHAVAAGWCPVGAVAACGPRCTRNSPTLLALAVHVCGETN